ncbi:hypothetical protein ACFO6R_12750 [Eubacterium multiforme]|uniref:Uncharacterized protein n=1 Tax=Eubacterium multiforme TaxID=83339 RepID=A0ABT9UW59_9FIRM|nr:hypothetical protein [Eubacterium multiforme]MDQ0150562.1 hypothetical protein [Eubacterium multiforme]
MAEFSGFFNSVNGDRKYKSEDFAKYFKTFMSTGVNPALDSLKVYKRNSTSIEIRQGAANIQGYMYLNDASLIKSVEVGTSRVDRVVLKLDLINRKLRIDVKKGSTSIPAALQRDNSVYELSLAKIYISGNDFSVADERHNTEVCGFMSFTGKADIQEMWDIFNSGWNSKQNLWQDWFNNMQGKSIRGIYIQPNMPSTKVGDIWIQLLE